MKLYYSPRSPYARKVLVVARERHVFDQLEVIELNVSAPSITLMRYNPLNKVPTLVLEDGTALYDSPVICEFLDCRRSGRSLFPGSGAARWDALRRQALGDGLMDLLIAWRGETLLPPEQQSKERIEAFAVKTEATLEVVTRDLQTQRADIDIGDIASGCALGYLNFRFPQLLRAGSALDQWFKTFDERESMKETRIPG
jgi:glutathione S-transferase